jgi:hypothetical protein
MEIVQSGCGRVQWNEIAAELEAQLKQKIKKSKFYNFKVSKIQNAERTRNKQVETMEIVASGCGRARSPAEARLYTVE